MKIENFYYFTNYESKFFFEDLDENDLKLNLEIFLDSQNLEMKNLEKKFSLSLTKNLQNLKTSKNFQKFKNLEKMEITLKKISKDQKNFSYIFLIITIFLNILLAFLTIKFIILKFDFKKLKNRHIPLYTIFASWVITTSSLRLIFLLPKLLNIYFFDHFNIDFRLQKTHKYANFIF